MATNQMIQLGLNGWEFCGFCQLLQIFQAPFDVVKFLDEVMLRHHACHSLTLFISSFRGDDFFHIYTQQSFNQFPNKHADGWLIFLNAGRPEHLHSWRDRPLWRQNNGLLPRPRYDTHRGASGWSITDALTLMTTAVDCGPRFCQSELPLLIYGRSWVDRGYWTGSVVQLNSHVNG